MRTFICSLLIILFIVTVLPRTSEAGWLRKLGRQIRRDVTQSAQQQQSQNNQASGASESAGPKGPVEELIERTRDCPPPKFPLDDEIAYGETIAAKMVNLYGSKLLDPNQNKIVWEYCNLLAQAMVPNSLRPELPTWRVGIVENDEVGAVSAPGGFIIITTGTLKSCRNEAELAGVIAHEMAHICRRHGLHTIWSGLKETVWIRHWAKNAKLPFMKKILSGFSDNIRKTTEFNLGPKKEHEADKLGAEFMYRTGYNPQGLIDFISRLPETKPRGRRGRSRGRGRRNKAYGLHPPKANRMKFLKDYCQEKLTGYDQLPMLAERYQKAVLANLPR